jgi:hypothetical protein
MRKAAIAARKIWELAAQRRILPSPPFLQSQAGAPE